MVERNKVYLMDCLEGMKTLLKPEEIDVIVTSPPYNFGIKYNKYDDSINRHKYLDWIEDVIKECKRVLKDDGSLFINLGYRPKDPYIAWEVASRVGKHFILQNVIHWIKSISLNDNSFGHYRPMTSKYFLNQCHEYIFHFTKNGDVVLDKLAIGVRYKDKSNIERWRKTDLRDRGNVWFIPYKTIRSKRPHPAIFPPELPMMCIKLHGLNKTKFVLDPFIGIGNTAIAAQQLGVDWIGFEIDEQYVRILEQRLKNESDFISTRLIHIRV